MTICTVQCVADQECTVCHRRKAPVGRSVPAECGGGYCTGDCHGYYADPKPGHLWPCEWPSERAAIESSSSPPDAAEGDGK